VRPRTRRTRGPLGFSTN